MALNVGDVLDGKYKVVCVIGVGGMGTVYEGEHLRIKRRVAIKTLLPNIANEEGIQRFEREAQAAGRIGNEHILEVLDLGVLGTGEHYMVMEFLDGQTLAQRIEVRGRLAADEIAVLGHQVLVALGAAHNAGIIHRDLKPENIFLLREKAGLKDFVKLIDFGISKFTGAGTELAKVTRMGSFLGTPTYMAPELCRGTADADARSDVYGLGVIMYEAVSGRLPFISDSFNDLLFQIVGQTPPHIKTLVPELDDPFAAMITRAMAKEPAERFQTAEEFANELAAWMDANMIAPTTIAKRASRVGRDSNRTAPRPALPTPSRSDIGSARTVSSADLTDSALKSGVLPENPSVKAIPGNTDSIARPWAASQASAPKRPNVVAIAGVAVAAVAVIVLVVSRMRGRADEPAHPTTATAGEVRSAGEPLVPTSTGPTPASVATAVPVLASAKDATPEAPPPAATDKQLSAVTNAGGKPRAATSLPRGTTITPSARASGPPGAPTTLPSSKAPGRDDEIPTMR